MVILTIRTDNPEAEIGVYDDENQLDYYTWTAHRQLAETLHLKIRDLLAKNDLDISKLDGILAFEGPGSFTGLRIGLTVANSLSYGLGVPIVGARGEDWQLAGVRKLLAGENTKQVMPHYGAPVHITEQKK